MIYRTRTINDILKVSILFTTFVKGLKLKNSGNQPEFIHQSKNEQS